MNDVIDERVLHILMKVENNSLSDVVDELALDSEIDELLEMREGLFKVAKDTLEYGWRTDKQLGDDEDSGIVLARRTRRSKQQNAAKEVIELYKYVTGMTNNFPRALLSKETKFLDLMPPEKPKEVDEETVKDNPLKDKLRIIELNNRMREQEKMIEKLLETSNQQQQAIDNLEQAFSEFQEKVKKDQYKQRKNMNNGNDVATSLSQQRANAFMDTCPPELWENLLKRRSVSPTRSPTVTPQKANQQGRVSHIIDMSGNDVTVLHKGRNLQSDVIGDIMQGKQPTTEHTTGAAAWPPLPSKVSSSIGYHPDNTLTEHSMAMEQQDRGAISATASRKLPTRIPPTVTSSRTYADAGRQKTMDVKAAGKGHTLKGRREEPISTLYLKNIYINNGEGDNDIEDTVRDYAMNKGMRIMSIKIMRYKTVRDIVGCRIIVPQPMEYMMCTLNFWPDGVTCRKWEPATTWYKNNRYSGNQQHGYRQDSRDGINEDRYMETRFKQNEKYYDYQINDRYAGDVNDNWE